MAVRFGIVGGMGPESTLDYYKLINELYRKHHQRNNPEFTIDSLNLDAITGYLEAGNLPALVEYFVTSIERLARAGCTVGALSSNTSHIVFDEVAARSPIPLLSIVEVAADAVSRLGARRPALLATSFTVKAGFYQAILGRRGMTPVVPSPNEQELIHRKYMDELVRGTFSPETRNTFVAIAKRLHAEGGADALILGGTEIPLLLREAVGIPVPVIDTARVHVERIVEIMGAADVSPVKDPLSLGYS
jgi:aspartate racemase